MFAHERSLVTTYRNRPFVLLGVNADESIDEFRRTQEKHDLNWRSWWDGPAAPIARKWKVDGLPSLYLLDAKGVIRWKKVGVPDPKEMDERIEEFVKEAETGSQKVARGGP